MSKNPFDLNISINPDKMVFGKEMLEAIDSFVKSNVQAMKDFLRENSDKEVSMVMDFMTSDLQIIEFPSFVTGLSKDQASRVMREILISNPIVSMISITEAWCLPQNNEENIEEIYRKYGSLQNAPGSIEVFLINAVYNRRGKLFCKTYSAPIITNPAKIRYLDETKEQYNENTAMTGRFVPDPDLLVPIEV